jgi:hypothetical protein
MKPDMYPDFVASCKAAGVIADIHEGEVGVIMADRAVEIDVVYGLWSAIADRGGQPIACLVERPMEWKIPKEILGAIEHANVVFHAWPSAEGEGRRLREEKGQRWVGFGDVRTLERFCGEAVRYPIPLLARLITKTRESVERGGTYADVHITDPKGTDLTFRHDEQGLLALWRDRRWAGKLIADEPGARGTLPPTHGPNILSTFAGKYNETLNGVVRYDAMVGFGGSYSGGFGDSTFAEPVTVEVKDGCITAITGSWEANILHGWLGEVGHIVEIGMGFNPKFPSYDGKTTGVAGGERSGSIHIGTSSPDGEHADGILYQPTVEVNGETIVRRGHLCALDDPELIELEKQFALGGEHSWLWEANHDYEARLFR